MKFTEFKVKYMGTRRLTPEIVRIHSPYKPRNPCKWTKTMLVNSSFYLWILKHIYLWIFISINQFILSMNLWVNWNCANEWIWMKNRSIKIIWKAIPSSLNELLFLRVSRSTKNTGIIEISQLFKSRSWLIHLDLITKVSPLGRILVPYRRFQARMQQ